MNKLFTLVLVFCFGISAISQTVVTGTVTDSGNGQPIPGANIIVVGTSAGASTDFDGKYTIKVNQAPPFTIKISSVGHEAVTKEVTKNPQIIDVALSEGNQLDEVVVSASRTPENVRESPVTIERMGLREIKNTSAASFYQGLENLKGVDVNTNSLTFNSVNTRGFATFANTRFVQLVDGMDNASPALNFVMGNLTGVSELDLKSVELLPGASSALYGANAFNGILFMTTKNPFDDAGISSYLKTGLTMQEAAGDNNFYDVGIRAAYKFSDKFAAKASFSYLKGTDWQAVDRDQYTNEGIPEGLPDRVTPFNKDDLVRNGLNVYGDEISLGLLGTNLNEVAQAIEARGIIPVGASALVPAVNVGRTGYLESDLSDSEAKSAKLDVAFHYRPFANDFEIVWNSRAGFGNTIYQGTNRYQLKDFFIQQHRLEFKNKDFFLRGYMVAEDAGDSYDMVFTGVNMNKVTSQQWFGAYAGAFVQNTIGGATEEQAHIAARQFADANFRPKPGTAAFNELFNQITSSPDFSKGSKFVDKTKMYVGEGNYNFSRLLNDAVNLQVGGSIRRYSLNSGGTIFTDKDGSIDYDEYGAYVQASKKFVDDRLKLTVSARYDKNEFFEGNLSPRASVVYSAGENRNHNFRASYQTGFRNPDTQSLFIGLDAGRAILVGSSPANLDKDLPNTDLTGRNAYYNSYSRASVRNFGQAVREAIPQIMVNEGATLQEAQQLAVLRNAAILDDTPTPLVKAEQVAAYDVGYRGRLGKIDIDANVYYNSYDGFINSKIVVAPKTGSVSDATGVQDVASGNIQAFSVYTNSTADVASYGANIGLNTKVKGFNIGVNYTYAKLDFDQAKEPDFSAGFNTPEHKVKLSFGNENLFKNLGFNVNARWNNSYLWQATFANAVIPERTVIDAQISLNVPKIKSVFKIGGANLGGKEYQSAPGTGFVGSQYYVSWVINN